MYDRLTLVYLKGEKGIRRSRYGAYHCDYFGEKSHIFYEDITAKQKAAQMYLRHVMLENTAFSPIEKMVALYIKK